MASLEIKPEFGTCLFPQSKPAPWQTTPGFVAQSEFRLEILNPSVPRGCGCLSPSLIRAESPYCLEEESPSQL